MAVNRFSSPTQYQYQSTFRALPVEQIGEIAMQMQQKQDTVKKEIQTYANNADLLASTVGGGDVSKVKDFASGVRNALQQAIDESGGVLTSNDFSFRYNQVMKNTSAQAGDIKEMQDAKAMADLARQKMLDRSTPDWEKASYARRLRVYDTEGKEGGKEGVKNFNASFYGTPSLAFDNGNTDYLSNVLYKDLKAFEDRLIDQESNYGIDEETVAPYVGGVKRGNTWQYKIPSWVSDSYESELTDRALYNLENSTQYLNASPEQQAAMLEREKGKIYHNEAKHAVQKVLHDKPVDEDDGGRDPNADPYNKPTPVIDALFSNKEHAFTPEVYSDLTGFTVYNSDEAINRGSSGYITVGQGDKLWLKLADPSDALLKDAYVDFGSRSKVVRSLNKIKLEAEERSNNYYALMDIYSDDVQKKNNARALWREQRSGDAAALQHQYTMETPDEDVYVKDYAQQKYEATVKSLNQIAELLEIDPMDESKNLTEERDRIQNAYDAKILENEEKDKQLLEALKKKDPDSTLTLDSLKKVNKLIESFTSGIEKFRGQLPGNIPRDKNKINVTTDEGYSKPVFVYDIVLTQDTFEELAERILGEKVDKNVWRDLKYLRKNGIDLTGESFLSQEGADTNALFTYRAYYDTNVSKSALIKADNRETNAPGGKEGQGLYKYKSDYIDSIVVAQRNAINEKIQNAAANK